MYKMQFDSEICAIYTLQTSQTRLTLPRHEARRARGRELARAMRRANRSRVLNDVSESGIGFTRLAPNSPRLASSCLVAISASCKAPKASAVILMSGLLLLSISFAISSRTNLMKLRRGMHIPMVF